MSEAAFKFLLQKGAQPFRPSTCFIVADPKVMDRKIWMLELDRPKDAEWVFQIDDIKVTTQYLNHPALTLGYRLEADGATIVYCCDHEPFSREVAEGRQAISGQDRQHADFIEGDTVLVDVNATGEMAFEKLVPLAA